MMDLLKYLNARLGEASTLAGITGLLALLHLHADPGVVKDITLYPGVAEVEPILHGAAGRVSDPYAGAVVKRQEGEGAALDPLGRRPQTPIH